MEFKLKFICFDLNCEIMSGYKRTDFAFLFRKKVLFTKEKPQNNSNKLMKNKEMFTK